MCIYRNDIKNELSSIIYTSLMELSEETIRMLYDEYTVYYNTNLRAWVRESGTSTKDYDLGAITKIITGENILEKNRSFIDERENGFESNVCVCGCNRCKMLYKLYHTKTNTAFYVGSSCITKADHLEFLSDMMAVERNGRCNVCMLPLRYNGCRKNSKKKYKGVCEDCRTETIIYLKISYDEKDYFKMRFNTRWDPNLRSWYWKGYEDQFPQKLICRRKIDV